MKYILKTPLLIVCFIIIFISGCFIGYNVLTNFSDLYISSLMLTPIRYALLFLVVSVNFLIFNLLNGSAITLRKKTLFDSLISMIKFEIIILFFIFAILHLPIIFLNISQSLKNLDLIIKIIINGVIVSWFLFSLIKIIDIKLKNRAVTCGIVLGSLCLIDFLLEHFNWFAFDNTIFDFSYIFILPFMYDNYFFIALILIVTGVLLTSLYVFIGIKKDCFLGNVYDEKN